MTTEETIRQKVNNSVNTAFRKLDDLSFEMDRKIYRWSVDLKFRMNKNHFDFLRKGDKIDTGGFVTTLEKVEITYWGKERIIKYWFYNENGELKFNVRDFITLIETKK